MNVSFVRTLTFSTQIVPANIILLYNLTLTFVFRILKGKFCFYIINYILYFYVCFTNFIILIIIVDINNPDLEYAWFTTKLFNSNFKRLPLRIYFIIDNFTFINLFPIISFSFLIEDYHWVTTSKGVFVSESFTRPLP